MRGPAGSTATLEWLPSTWPPAPPTSSTSPTSLYASAPSSSSSSQGSSEVAGAGPQSGVAGGWMGIAGFPSGPRPGSVSGMGVGEEEGRSSGLPVGAVASVGAGVEARAGVRGSRGTDGGITDGGGAAAVHTVTAWVGSGGGDASARHVSELERRDLPQPAVKVRTGGGRGC